MGTVLVLARDVPYPPNAGDRVVTHGFVRGLVERGHDVHVVSLGSSEAQSASDQASGEDSETPPESRNASEEERPASADDPRASDRERARALAETAESVRLVPRARSRLPARLRKLRNYARGRSDVMAMFETPALARTASRAISALEPDAVLAQHPYVGQAFREPDVRRAAERAGSRLVTNAHVVEFAVHRRYRELADDRETRAELRFEIPRLRREELAVYEASDRVVVLGTEDRAVLERSGVETPVAVQHVALDLDEYEPAVPEGEDAVVSAGEDADVGETSSTADLLFFGSYGWFPNEDAVTTFVAEALPRIRAERPDARLVVAGRNAPESVRALGDRPGVEFVGEVPDLAGAVRDAAAVVAPLRVGGGTRLKVLESMAWGAPVVTTAAGFEGVDARPGADVAVADDWDAFADRTLDLLDSPARRARLGRNARRRIEQVYALDEAAAELEVNLGLRGETGENDEAGERAEETGVRTPVERGDAERAGTECADAERDEETPR